MVRSSVVNQERPEILFVNVSHVRKNDAATVFFAALIVVCGYVVTIVCIFATVVVLIIRMLIQTKITGVTTVALLMNVGMALYVRISFVNYAMVNALDITMKFVLVVNFA